MLKDYFNLSSFDTFIDTPLSASRISNHPYLGSSVQLSLKYYNENNILSNIMNFVVRF
jgi:hypothetical protein